MEWSKSARSIVLDSDKGLNTNAKVKEEKENK